MASATVLFDVDSLLLGASPFVLQAYRIHVPAQSLVLCGGSVTLIANEIVFDAGAVIDISGAPGLPKVVANSGTSPGVNGDDGVKGQNGQDGGSLYIYAGTITGTATIKANGGDGGPGENGGDGAVGATGPQGSNGGQGGDAGGGGAGGDGGDGGTIRVLAGDLGGAQLTFSTDGGLAGQGGSPGVPGGAGAAGIPSGHYSGPHGEGYVAGPPTYPGIPGNVRPSQGAGATGSQGTATSVQNLTSVLSTILPLLDPSYWATLLQNGSSLYQNETYSDATSVLSWIDAIGSSNAPTVDTAVNRARVLLAQLNTGMDFYGHPKNYAQALSVGAYETTNASLINDGISLESALSNYQQQRQSQVDRVAALTTSTQKAQSQIATNTQSRSGLIDQGGSLTVQLQELLSQELDALSAVNQTAAALQAALSAGQGCSFAEIMSAVSLIVTFASGLPIGATAIASSATAVGNQLSQPPTMDGIKSIIKNVQVISTTINNQVSAVNQITAAYQKLKSSQNGNVPAPGDDDTKFLMSDADLASVRQSFENQVSQLPASQQKDDYTNAVNNYLNIVQIRNQQLLSFNGLAFKIQGLDDNTATLQSQVGALNSQMLAAQAADISGLLDQLTALRDALLQSVYFNLLQHSRALDYWTLDPQPLPSSYADFGALKGILGTLTQRKTDALQLLANPPASFSTGQPYTVPLDAAAIANLQQTGILYFTLTSDMSIFVNLSQVLLSTINVTFGLQDGSTLTPSSYSLEHSGYHKFIKSNKTDTYEFLTRPRTVIFAQGAINISNSFTGPDTSLDPSNPSASFYVGVSPFSRWKLTVTNGPGAFVALANVTQLQLNLTGSGRPFV